MFQGGLPLFDITNADIQALVAGMVSSAVITQDQADELFALGATSTPYTQAAYGVPYITADDVAAAKARA
jgi:hypothetical protein